MKETFKHYEKFALLEMPKILFHIPIILFFEWLFCYRRLITLTIIEEDSYEKDVLFYVQLGEPQMSGGKKFSSFFVVYVFLFFNKHNSLHISQLSSTLLTVCIYCCYVCTDASMSSRHLLRSWIDWFVEWSRRVMSFVHAS